jgi:hypothetical protein
MSLSRFFPSRFFLSVLSLGSFSLYVSLCLSRFSLCLSLSVLSRFSLGSLSLFFHRYDSAASTSANGGTRQLKFQQIASAISSLQDGKVEQHLVSAYSLFTLGSLSVHSRFTLGSLSVHFLFPVVLCTWRLMIELFCCFFCFFSWWRNVICQPCTRNMWCWMF